MTLAAGFDAWGRFRKRRRSSSTLVERGFFEMRDAWNQQRAIDVKTA
jgi:hypothetical protein